MPCPGHRKNMSYVETGQPSAKVPIKPRWVLRLGTEDITAGKIVNRIDVLRERIGHEVAQSMRVLALEPYGKAVVVGVELVVDINNVGRQAREPHVLIC